MRCFKKEEIETYDDEDKFTEEVVMPLMEFIFSNSDISQNGAYKIEFWGKNKRLEGGYGFDIYLGYYDYFHRQKNIVIQCKVGNITLASNASIPSSIETIGNQIKKAYISSFTSPLDPNIVSKVDGFYIITSGSINQTARDYYRGLGYTNVDCLDSSDLAFLFKKYFKEDQRNV